MVELDEKGKPYRLATAAKIDQMFALPLALIRAIGGMEERNPKFKYLSRQAMVYRTDKQLQKEMSCTSYLVRENTENPELVAAARMLVNHSPKSVINTAKGAKQHQSSKQGIFLLTAHTSKGQSYDEITLSDDMNEAIEEVMLKLQANRNYKITSLEKQELMLYYVAVTRARFVINNAEYLYIPDV